MTTERLTQGLLHLPGSTSETKALVERLLEEDSQKHHCFYGQIGFHNHLAHHILTAYDLSAPAKVLQAIYDAEAEIQSPINLVDRKEQKVGVVDTVITRENWTEHIGPEKNYISFFRFFRSEVERIGAAECLEEYIFSPSANGNGSNMFLRFFGGALHPFIQIGYGVEFHIGTLVASGLAQAAVTNPLPASIYYDGSPESSKEALSRAPSLLSIIRMMYDSDVLRPFMPYQPDLLLSTRMKETLVDGRPEEIRRLSSMWNIDTSLGDAELEKLIEEVFWAVTLLTFSTGKHKRKPRLDFFLMHLLTSSLFLPSFIRAIKTPEIKARVLRAYLSVILLIILLRGRPRIDPTLIMTYTLVPRPPVVSETQPAPDSSALGDPSDVECINPWQALIGSVIYAPDAHTLKSLRTLYYGAQKYGETPPGEMPGAFDENGEETLKGSSQLDGTIFVRAAGVLMGTLGWVSRGQKEGEWDRSALGWDAAWDGPEP